MCRAGAQWCEREIEAPRAEREGERAEQRRGSERETRRREEGDRNGAERSGVKAAVRDTHTQKDKDRGVGITSKSLAPRVSARGNGASSHEVFR